jgi:hypothetical protein
VHADLHAKLCQIGVVAEGSGIIDGSVVEEALWGLVNQNERKIPINAFDTKLVEQFQDIDKNKDGFMDYSELEEAVLVMINQKKRIRQLVCLLGTMFLLSLIFLAAIFGLVYVVVDMQKV